MFARKSRLKSNAMRRCAVEKPAVVRHCAEDTMQPRTPKGWAQRQRRERGDLA